MSYKIKWMRPWPSEDIQSDEYLLSTRILTEEADALLADWEPAWELLHFNRPKVWYCCEPQDSSRFAHEKWVGAPRNLAEDEKLNHWHPNLECRVPRITHVGPIQASRNRERADKACAIVSNSGVKLFSEPSAAKGLRNKFCTFKEVDLYGRKDAWRNCRRHFWSSPTLPANYRGEVEGADWVGAKNKLMTGYKVAVCLESTQEPYYFTEKFVAAVQSGCIPVYQAHESVKQTFLPGAKWVDPADYGFDPGETLKAALSKRIEDYWDANAAWLTRPVIVATEREHVLHRIADLLCRRIAKAESEKAVQ